MAKEGRYRCIHCGERFDISPAEQNDMDEGFYEFQPDCCDDCLDMLNHPSFDISDLHSDADPGL